LAGKNKISASRTKVLKIFYAEENKNNTLISAIMLRQELKVDRKYKE
jgi:hypothetical protein